MTSRVRPPSWGLAATVLMTLVCSILPPEVVAQPRRPTPARPDRPAKADKPAPAPVGDKGDKSDKADQGDKSAKKKPKVFDFNALDLAGRNRSPQLLYFLERASEELERANLEKRSFVPHMVRSIEEEAL